MNEAPSILIIASLAIAACGSNGPDRDARATARGFAEAMVAGDIERAKTFLRGCEHVAAETRDACDEALRARGDRLEQVGGYFFPVGATVVSVEPMHVDEMPVGLAQWMVKFDFTHVPEPDDVGVEVRRDTDVFTEEADGTTFISSP